jgi:DNA invertase Pin-like site-specific DNA recombinase
MIGIYARQSIDKKDSISVETQIETCLKELGLPEPSLYKVYVDKGYSGGSLKRPDFERLAGEIKSGLIHQVVTYKLDRISR